MKLFKRTPDPLAARTKALSAEIKRLESEISTLATEKSAPPKPPPAAAAATAASRTQSAPERPREDRPRVIASTPPLPQPVVAVRTPVAPAPPTSPQDPHFNDLGVRKYDLVSAWRRFTSHLSGPTSNNPKMVQYLAAGSIQGLRPLRYEKRVARNRFLALLALLILVLWGLAYWSFKR